MKKLFYCICLFLASCEDKDDPGPTDFGTVFDRAHLPFPAYDYVDTETGDSVHVFGDDFVFTFIAPECENGCPPEQFYEQFSQHFVIKWTPLGSINNVAIGIFNEIISLSSDYTISNNTDMVWSWHRKMGTGNLGEVRFIDGKSLKNDTIDYYNPPNILDLNQIYYLGIWVWNEEGTQIEYSTYPIKIKIVQP